VYDGQKLLLLVIVLIGRLFFLVLSVIIGIYCPVNLMIRAKQSQISDSASLWCCLLVSQFEYTAQIQIRATTWRLTDTQFNIFVACFGQDVT